MIIISEHARTRMEQRSIDEAQVLAALSSPDMVADSFRGRKVAAKELGGRTLAVISVREGETVTGVTAYWVEEG